MTTYTADDFKNAKYAARHRDGRTATRREQLGGWITSHDLRQNDQEMAGNGWVPVQENPRTLTPDAITDEGVKRAQVAWLEKATSEGMPSSALVRIMFAAALTPPPSRPEGAEEIEGPLRQVLRLNGQAPDETTVSALSDALAERGVWAGGDS